jgi:hypothetical protein
MGRLRCPNFCGTDGKPTFHLHAHLSSLATGGNHCTSIKELSRLGRMRTTGPFQNTEDGASFQSAPCRKQNRFVPVEPSLNTAIRFGLRRSSACTIHQFQRHGMLRVPKLACASVCNSSDGGTTRRSPVRRQNRLPYYKHTDLSVGVPRQQLLSCGGPPQTSRSSRRQQ